MISPLFAPSPEELRLSLRLSAIDETSGVFAMVEAIIREVRIGFIRYLGITRVNDLKAIVYDPETDPADNDEFLREVANITEQLWCRKLMIERLPTTWLDSSGQRQRTWNEDAFTRETPHLEDELLRLQQQIDQNLALLGESESAGEETTLGVITIEPDPPVPDMEASTFADGVGLGPYDG